MFMLRNFALFFAFFLVSAGQLVCAGESAGSSTNDPANIEANVGNTHYFFGVRPWATSWDIPVQDVKTIVVNPVGPVVALQEMSVQIESDITTIPVFVIGARHGDYTVSASYSPKMSYSTSGMVAGDVSRSEADISLGYSFTPNIVGSLVYRRGEIDHALSTNSVAVTGFNVGYTIEAILAGVSVSTPLYGNYSLYGNFAFGPAQEKTAFNQKYDGTYKIGEIGISSKIVDSPLSSVFKAMSWQIGYRFQNVAIQDIKFNTYSIPAGTVLSQEFKDISSTTHGFVLGLVGVF